MSATKAPWWQGKRGEWYVVAQLVLIALVFLGPRSLHFLPAWHESLVPFGSVVGGLLMFAGLCLLFSGIFQLRSNLTPLPYPRAHATLVETGPYRFVRHPMYAGGVVLAYGWALFVQGWLTLLYATILFLFADIKSAREERWLIEKFPEYRDYQRRVRKLIPFIH